MKIILTLLIMFVFAVYVQATDFEKDVFKTSGGDLEITFIAHGTLMMEYNGKVIHIDPVSWYADYATMPKADLILITHEHGDHLDAKALDAVKKDGTELVLTEICNQQYGGTKVLKNGESGTFAGIKVDAVPAYNIKNEREPGKPFHPKGTGNGYVLHFGDKKVYVAGDTENIPEMAELKDIDVAFLPMNLPYTMTPEMVAEATKMFQPKVLYPYHFGETNTDELVELLKNQNKTELRIRNLK
ncbi:MBL fold metallo-hydrolase [Draconibacterium sp. IB214405]|uniref:MBL fold metallo-hydrolase n=1 Tax=Draconibacterium sp. IB214405 TaxID=3097352 RepID=UPI002A109E72|nr:MBL fold metallo-hydrolase [Draconibacterium sp. IB214405]MDX8338097.1 MBL fold metallo-hydrolase [Draconibacterium sp. IB214405]